MNAKDFVSSVRKEVIEDNFATYLKVLGGNTSEVRDPYWRTLLAAYSAMNQEQRTVIQLVMRQVAVDTVSSMFGILDGTTLLDNYREDFLLTYGSGSIKLNGDLQDYFLADEAQ